MNRKSVFTAALIIVFICVLTPAFNMKPLSPQIVAAATLESDMPVVFVDPQNVTANPGDNFTISVKIFNLTDTIYKSNVEWVPGQPLPTPDSLNVYTLGNLYGLDIQLSWDPTILEYVSHAVKIPVETYPDGVLHEPIQHLMDYVDSSAGTYWLAKLSQPPAPAFNCQDANATVFTMTFNVTRRGACALDLTSIDLAADPDMLEVNGGPINMLAIPHWVRDSKFQDILATGIKSVKVEAHVDDLFFGLPVISGENARVTIVMENYGEISDTYNLTLYKGTDSLETWNNEILESGENKTFNYTITAEDLNVGDHVITVKATILHGNETLTDEVPREFSVIGTPSLTIAGPTTAELGDEVSFNASDSIHGDPNGAILYYTWTLTAPGESIPRVMIEGSSEAVTFVTSPGWPAGSWTVVLEVEDNYGVEYDSSRPATAPYRKEISLQLGEPPSISIVWPQNMSYSVNDVPLIFTLSGLTSWIGYSLDEQGNVTINGNTTMVGLSEGSHTITVYANDTVGFMGYSERVFFTVDTLSPNIVILSPENETYATASVSLVFFIDEPVEWTGYSLNGQSNVTVTGNVAFFDLGDGVHTIVVYANDTCGNMGYSNTAQFAIDTVSPNIEILAPENKTYTTNSVSLNFTVDEPASWMGYSLDGDLNQTIQATSITLSELPDGSHRIIVYIKDAAGNTGTSEIIYFTVETPQEEPFPTLIVAVIVTIAAVGAAVLAYFTKFKK